MTNDEMLEIALRLYAEQPLLIDGYCRQLCETTGIAPGVLARICLVAANKECPAEYFAEMICEEIDLMNQRPGAGRNST